MKTPFVNLKHIGVHYRSKYKFLIYKEKIKMKENYDIKNKNTVYHKGEFKKVHTFHILMKQKMIIFVLLR